MVMDEAAVNRFALNCLLGIVVGPTLDLRATGDYFGWYFPARHLATGRIAAMCHVSMMHSRAHRALAPDQLERLVQRAQRTLPSKPVLILGPHALVQNRNGSLRRSWVDLQGTSVLVQELWVLWNMISNR